MWRIITNINKQTKMENYKNLLDLLDKSDEEIGYYLEDVSIEQFKKDIIEFAKINMDKVVILDLINKLKAMV